MRRYDFNRGWLFEKLSVQESAAVVTAAGGPVPVTLPHDAMQIEARRADAPSGAGGAYYEGGRYRYTKELDVPADWADRRVELEFGGVMAHAEVRVNGELLASVPYGYRPFLVRIDSVLVPGKTNVVEVRCSTEDQPNSRWYAGGGIYRPVELWLGAPGTAAVADAAAAPDTGAVAAIGPWDLRVETLSYKPAVVWVTGVPTDATIEILDADGAVVATGTGAPCDLEIPDAHLWSDETPYLYTCRVTVAAEKTNMAAGMGDATPMLEPEVGPEAEPEVAEVRFGVRALSWGPRGFFVNGRETLLRGGCIHHDNGILGAASPAEADWRRVRLLKEAGFNAIRSSHNPASRGLLDACDELGVYVMDEAWDMWYRHKNPADYATDWPEYHADDLAAMVAHDFNHPSVVMYSVANEVSEPCDEQGVQTLRDLVAEMRRLDPSRPTGAGINLAILLGSCLGADTYKEGGGRDTRADEGMDATGSLLFNLIADKVGGAMNHACDLPFADRLVSPALDPLDIAGYNYASGRYPLEGSAHPDRLIVGSETFPQDIAKNWAMVERYPYLIGDFMWTAWDYLGEVGSGAWTWRQDERGFEKPYPWLLADTGALDILGNPTGDLYWAQATWGVLARPAISVKPPNHPGVEAQRATWRGTNSLPSWSWRGCEGNLAPVEVYFPCKHVELWLNGRLVARRRCRDGRATFLPRYEPGVLTAVAFDEDDHEIARSELRTATALQVQVRAEKTDVAPGELVYFDVWIGDEAIAESNADELLHAEATGGELLAFGSANPRTEERFTTGDYTSYYGRALAVVRAGGEGSVRLTVTSALGSASAEAAIASAPAPTPASAPAPAPAPAPIPIANEE